MRFEWKPEKNAWLRQYRRMSFEEIVVHLGRGDAWNTSRHPNRKKYPKQSIASVVVDDHVCLVAFDEGGEVILLRTVIPSRKATRQYLEEKKRES